jgi:hypothetical protein
MTRRVRGAPGVGEKNNLVTFFSSLDWLTVLSPTIDHRQKMQSENQT